MTLKVLSLFSGIGAIEKALQNSNIPHQLIGFSEINKPAIQSYCVIHSVDKSLNLGDISKVDVDNIPDVDLISYTFPCQAISSIGKQRGFSKGSGTTSSLLWDALHVIKHKKPKYAIAENVKNIVSKKFKQDFDMWLKELDEMGYNTYYQILNAKDFGIPQNRERFFAVSIRKDIDDGLFTFPKPSEITKELWDILDKKVDETYYVSDILLDSIRNTKYKKTTYKDTTEKILSNGYETPLIMDYRYDEGLRVRKNNLCPTLTTRGNQSISGVPIIYLPNERLRFITPLECWRLMGFTDEDFYKAKESGVSDTQLYKQAGNSIVVPVLEGILKQLFFKTEDI